MSKQRDRAEFIHFFMKYAPVTLETSFGSLHIAAKRLMRYAATHVRIETELTNGYKDSRGNWDAIRTAQSIAKRNRIALDLRVRESRDYELQRGVRRKP